MFIIQNPNQKRTVLHKWAFFAVLRNSKTAFILFTFLETSSPLTFSSWPLNNSARRHIMLTVWLNAFPFVTAMFLLIFIQKCKKIDHSYLYMNRNQGNTSHGILGVYSFPFLHHIVSSYYKQFYVNSLVILINSNFSLIRDPY